MYINWKLYLCLHINNQNILTMKEKDEILEIQSKIYEIRGQKVMLDRDLAEMYGVMTKVLNQAVKRNPDRFPDFMFQLTNKDTRIQLELVNKTLAELQV